MIGTKSPTVVLHLKTDSELDAAARWNTRIWACLMLSGIAAAGILGALIGSALVRWGLF